MEPAAANASKMARHELYVVNLQELPCGHFMHSHCFGQYTRYNYTCPLCSKSLGDMAVYFQVCLGCRCDMPVCVSVELTEYGLWCCVMLSPLRHMSR